MINYCYFLSVWPTIIKLLYVKWLTIFNCRSRLRVVSFWMPNFIRFSAPENTSLSDFGGQAHDECNIQTESNNIVQATPGIYTAVIRANPSHIMWLSVCKTEPICKSMWLMQNMFRCYFWGSKNTRHRYIHGFTKILISSVNCFHSCLCSDQSQKATAALICVGHTEKSKASAAPAPSTSKGNVKSRAITAPTPSTSKAASLHQKSKGTHSYSEGELATRS